MAARTSTSCTRSLRQITNSRTYFRSISVSQHPILRQDSTSQRTYHSSRPQPIPTTLSPFQSRHASSSSSSSSLKTLPLNTFHLSHNAKMVPFADHSMPLVYSDQTHLQSHHWTRTKASLFDVGHMLQHTFSGPGVEALLHKITPAYLPSLAPLQSTLSVLLHPTTGGIVDDTMITKLDRPLTYRLVTNGATAEKVTTYLTQELSSNPSAANGGIHWSTNHSHNSGLLALQGPLSAEILTSLLSPLDGKKLQSLFFGQSSFFPLRGVYGPPILVSRGGYTGEDGFELATHSPAQTVDLADALWRAGGQGEKVRLAGLGARDSLRLEAGMCLYGHDLDDSTTPVEAGLGWVVAKERRTDGGGFHGAQVILPQLVKKSEGGAPPARKRVGLVVDGVPAREGAKILSVEKNGDGEGEEIGVVTSGGPSPTTGKNIAMGYIKNKPGFVKTGSEVKVLVRGKVRSATVVKMPFVEAKYYRVIAEGEVKKESIKDAATTGAAPM